MGFDQKENIRAYRFDGLVKGGPTLPFVVSADLALFLAHHIGIQEGPSLCALKLFSVPELPAGSNLELTSDDLRAHVAARAETEARRAAMRKAGSRRHAHGEQPEA